MRGTPRLPSSDFDERRLLAADIGAGAQMNLDVEIEPFDPKDRASEQSFAAAARERRFELVAQIAIFAAQIEKAAIGRKREGREGHAFEHMVGHERQQHAILESAGLAFIGVADDDPPPRPLCGSLAAELPFARRCEAGAAAPPQAGTRKLGHQRLGPQLHGPAQGAPG